MRRLRTSAPSGIPGPGGGLCALRRLRRSVCGSFSCLYVQLMLIFYVQAAGILACCHFGFSQGLSLTSRGPFVYAQDAWIRLRHFVLYDYIYITGLFFMRRLRGSVPAAFWLLPGDALRPLGVVVVVIFFHRLQRSVSANT